MPRKESQDIEESYGIGRMPFLGPIQIKAICHSHLPFNRTRGRDAVNEWKEQRKYKREKARTIWQQSSLSCIVSRRHHENGMAMAKQMNAYYFHCSAPYGSCVLSRIFSLPFPLVHCITPSRPVGWQMAYGKWLYLDRPPFVYLLNERPRSKNVVTSF